MSRGVRIVGVMGVLCVAVGSAHGFGVSLDGNGYAARWDSAPRFVNGSDRSLSGGLEFNVSNGAVSGYAAFASALTYDPSEAPMTAAEMEQLVNEAFAAWTATDPATGAGTSLTFTFDALAPVNPFDPSFGAEIEIAAFPLDYDASKGGWERGFTQRVAANAGVAGVELTSGTTGHPGQFIYGADIWISSSPQAQWTRDRLRLLLTHEIGLALGLVDVDVDAGPFGLFLDDDFDGTSTETAVATLTNAWLDQIDPFDPEGSDVLGSYAVSNGDPGFGSEGVDIVMETRLPEALLGNLQPLSADDYAGRQFLYPVVMTIPEPEPVAWVVLALAWVVLRRVRRRRLPAGRS